MKIVINTCFGGFGLSAKAIKRYAELKSWECYFFDNNENQITLEEAGETWLSHAYKVPNPPKSPDPEDWCEMTEEQRSEFNRKYEEVAIIERSIERNDPILVQVVEELGNAASGTYADLSIVEIPDDVQWQIEEYDGSEHIAEKHRTWR